jgi:hypothetical protein
MINIFIMRATVSFSGTAVLHAIIIEDNYTFLTLDSDHNTPANLSGNPSSAPLNV